MPSLKTKLRNKLNPPDFKGKLVELFLKPFFNGYEKQQRKKWNASPSRREPVFIIGPPRSGSTLLYSVLTYKADVLYISNFTHAYASALFTGFKKFMSRDPDMKADFKSDFGETHKSGPAAPSECARFWYYYLSKERHYTLPDDVSEEGKRFYKDYINGLMNKYDKPFLFKNLNAAVRIPFLRDLFPRAKFIFIYRDPFYNAQSVISAKRELGVGKGDWWSVKPENYADLAGLDEIESAVGQCFHIEKHILEDTRGLGDRQFISVSYERLCNDSRLELENLSRFLGKSVFNDFTLPEDAINISNKRRLSDRESELLNNAIEKSKWRELRKRFHER